MASVTAKKGSLSFTAYRGDAKTLLAFNLDKQSAKNLAGFTIQCQPGDKPGYYLFNQLQFKTPADHAQDAKEPPRSSINAPIHKFRWVHVLGAVHQGIKPFFGTYTYTVTPRYFDNGRLLPLDPSLSASLKIEVGEFTKGNLELGFTRGYTQSQAFVNHFGPTAKIKPQPPKLLYDTSMLAATNSQGVTYTYEDEYEWLGLTAREKIFSIVSDVLKNKTRVIDVFAYDLNETDILQLLLKLAKQGRIRLILDNSKDHHDKQNSKPEDQFAKLFTKAAGAKQLLQRGMFKRYAHDKVIIVYKEKTRKTPLHVLTGSTNFSATGLYVNSNHVLVYNDREVAGWYASVFAKVWETQVKLTPFVQSNWSLKTFSSSAKATPKSDFTFAPHDSATSAKVLKTVTDRITAEGKKSKSEGSVLFAVMQISTPKRKKTSVKSAGGRSKKPAVGNPVYDALNNLHKNERIFSYGISDSPDGIALYPIGKKIGVLVTGKPSQTILPPPFNQVPAIKGFGHQVHHKFVVCGFNTPDAVVFCGSSNLSTGGEESNGDNLLAIHDQDIATVFAIEALLLVDHFDFLDNMPKASMGNAKVRGKGKAKIARPTASQHQAAMNAGWFLSTDGQWATKYFNSNDLHCVDRQLFGG
jgi:phosphatidylserine/phosphatidylglycerophosphate/cardiolipin synthase-like enzyme